MKSFLNRYLRKKAPGDQQAPPEKPDQPEQASAGDHTFMPHINDLSINPDIKLPVDVQQLIVGVGQSAGIQRTRNEDALFTLSTNLSSHEKILHLGLFIIADGMGGHENGEIASRVAVEKFSSHVISSFFLPLLSAQDHNMEFSIQEVMEAGILKAHNTIKSEALGGGTTLSAVLILGDQMTVAHVGDSRVYLINQDGTSQLLTHDHSMVKRLEEIGQISPEQAANHPQRNVLYRAVGQGEQVEPEIATYNLLPGSQVILCTDGLWGVISENEIISAALSKNEPQQVCQLLVNSANLAGGPDNISVILVRLPE